MIDADGPNTQGETRMTACQGQGTVGDDDGEDDENSSAYDRDDEKQEKLPEFHGHCHQCLSKEDPWDYNPWHEKQLL